MNEVLKRRLIGGAVLLAALVAVTGVFFRGGEMTPPEETTLKAGTENYDLEYPEGAELLSGAEEQASTQIGTIPAAPESEFPPPEEAPNQKRVRSGEQAVAALPAGGEAVKASPATTPETKPAPKVEKPKAAIAPVPPPPQTTPAPVSPAPKAVAAGDWAVQVGSFASRNNAASIEKKLAGMGYPAFISKTDGPSPVMYRVRTGPYPSQEQAREAAARLREQLKQDVKVVAAR